MEINDFVPPEELRARFGTKRDLYDLLTIDLGYFLPSEKRISVDFMKKILSKKKLVLTVKEGRSIVVPKYKEFGIKIIWNYIKEVDDPKLYFPDFSEKELPEREYMWCIINTFRPEATKSLYKKAIDSRSIKCEDNKDNLVEIHPEILEEINNVGIRGPNKGKIAYLLRKGSKAVGRQRAIPKEYPANLSDLKYDRNYENFERDEDNKQEHSVDLHAEMMRVDREEVKSTQYQRRVIIPQLDISRIGNFRRKYGYDY